MEIIGRGFFARNLEPLAGAHPGVTVLAAGVSRTRTVPPAEYRREEDLVARTLKECAERGRTLVFLSTCSASLYGDDGRPGREDAPLAPASPYGRHKLGLEDAIRRSGVRHLILRVTHTVGPHQTGQLLVGLARQLKAGGVQVHRGTRRDLIDVADVVAVLDDLLRAGVAQEVVNVASGVSVPIEDIVDHLESRLGTAADREYVDTASVQAVSIDKLRRLAPAAAHLGFGPGYYRTVIDRHAADLAAAEEVP